MTLRLQTESPADQDMFRGSSHEKVAENVAQIIRTPDVNIIGLEGELGSGKSTILKFLQKKLKDDFTFINFDAERYHHGSTKKSAYRCHPPRGQPTMSGLPGCVG